MQIADIEASILGGMHISDSELMEAFDLLMYQLVILDASKVEGETNVKKTILVCSLSQSNALCIVNSAYQVLPVFEEKINQLVGMFGT